jgi:cytochrome o ubiquinol oxidase subunit IV
MSGNAFNKSERRRGRGFVLDVLLILLTLGLAVWYRAERSQHYRDDTFIKDARTADYAMDYSAAYKSELRSYVTGLVLALLLTVPPFALVVWHGAPRNTILWIVTGAAVAQVAVHLRYFLHINLSRSKRDDLQLILFSILIVAMMVGGTIWILANLRYRMM